MIIVSAHVDTVYRPTKLTFEGGVHTGLLDNFVGVLVTYLAIYGNETMRELAVSGQVKVLHTTGEEFMRPLPPAAVKARGAKNFALVVDVAAGAQYRSLDFSLENVANVPAPRVKEIKETLEWEGYAMRLKRYDGNKDDEDEAWAWREAKWPTASFIIPIEGKNDSWHRTQEDNTISHQKVAIAARALVRVVNVLGTWYLE